MSDTTKRWYGVSYGNGNDGVSHSFPDFYVMCDDPWTLARAAVISNLNDRQWAAEAVEVDGEAEYTISAIIHEGPEGETEFEAAWLICEVFPVEDADLPDRADPWHKPMYDSLNEAIDTASLALARTE